MTLSEEFLENFTKELILNSAPVYMLREIENKRRLEFRKNITENLENEVTINKNPETKESSRVIANRIQIQQSFSKEKQIPRQPKIQDLPNHQVKDLEQSNAFEKINPLIEDQSITAIECLGPEKFILIHRRSGTKAIKITLDKHEINSILDNFSQESRIPRVGGVFKTISGNLIITAIDSDFGGPRFIIRKVQSQNSMLL
jgi:hypothetical protein